MKIFRVDRSLDADFSAVSRALERDEAPQPDILPVRLMPDSSLLLKGDPVFLPEFARGWHFMAVPVFRVGRLGKFIAPKYAWRYIDGVCAGAVLMPPGEVRSDLACCFDSAAALSPWVKPDELPAGDFMLQIGDKILHIDTAQMHIEETVALLSRFSTLRTGDIIIPCLTPLTVPAEIGLYAALALVNASVRRLRVK